MASNAPCVALVIKCQPRCDRSLLTVNKRNVFGLFTTSPLPRVGTLIALEFTDCPLEGATIVVSKWSYYPCDPFWQLNVKEVGGVAKVVMEGYRGIVHAVGRGPTQTSHFITSRYFPSDVLLRTRRDENIDHIKVLYGREVTFEVGIENLN
ncbi:unnamed protein product, partial [Nippostrongylus brasiliensis]|uniref:DUF663 domain-containing protein n=1 Tax=Nippostrongylus brasiliensis TaxID=27835 RepID=A0A0N4Y2U3_NIPBR